MRPRRNRPLFIIDIAVPRDVEPGVGELDQVFLYNIDDLQTIVKENLARRGGELERAEAIVERRGDAVHGVDAVARGRADGRRAAPAVRDDPAGGAAAARAEAGGLPPEARARVDEITRLIVEKLLLTPTEQLKAARRRSDGDAYADALQPAVQPAARPGSGGDDGARRCDRSDTRGRLRE